MNLKYLILFLIVMGVSHAHALRCEDLFRDTPLNSADERVAIVENLIHRLAQQFLQLQANNFASPTQHQMARTHYLNDEAMALRTVPDFKIRFKSALDEIRTANTLETQAKKLAEKLARETKTAEETLHPNSIKKILDPKLVLEQDILTGRLAAESDIAPGLLTQKNGASRLVDFKTTKTIFDVKDSRHFIVTYSDKHVFMHGQKGYEVKEILTGNTVFVFSQPPSEYIASARYSQDGTHIYLQVKNPTNPEGTYKLQIIDALTGEIKHTISDGWWAGDNRVLRANVPTQTIDLLNLSDMKVVQSVKGIDLTMYDRLEYSPELNIFRSFKRNTPKVSEWIELNSIPYVVDKIGTQDFALAKNSSVYAVALKAQDIGQDSMIEVHDVKTRRVIRVHTIEGAIKNFVAAQGDLLIYSVQSSSSAESGTFVMNMIHGEVLKLEDRHEDLHMYSDGEYAAVWYSTRKESSFQSIYKVFKLY